MPKPTINSPSPAILRLAAEAGVAPNWIDAWGEPKVVANDDLVAVLCALTGAQLGSEQSVLDVTRDLVDSRPTCPPVIVAWDGVFPDTQVSASVRSAAVVTEGGEEHIVTVDDRLLRLSSTLPVGYHTLVIDGGRTTSHVFSAPMRAHPAPHNALGLIAPTYSLRSEHHDNGLGTVADLSALADLCHSAGVEVVGTLPLLAAFVAEPSPYAPASRRAWNELFVDFASIPDWHDEPPHVEHRGLMVDYDAAGDRIRSALGAYVDHVDATPRLRSNVDAYLGSEPEIRRYARFRASVDLHGRNWRAWPDVSHGSQGRIRYHETVQWLMNSQISKLSGSMRSRGQYLYLDLPIGCHPDGYDIWDTPDLFAKASLGAPPDTLFVGGQDWGLPASIPGRAREDGHQNFRKAIRKQLSVAGLLRIDHVMGIHRTWWVPHGSLATQGAFVMQSADDMFAIICIESHRASSGVVGENLGTVPPEIRTGLDDHALLGMAGVQDAANDPSPTDLVFMSSHDSPSFSAWWNANDIDDLFALGVFDEARATHERHLRSEHIGAMQAKFGTADAEATRDALMAWMARSEASVALLTLDDLLMEERRQNVPGTHRERPNWRLRNPRTLESVAGDPPLTDQLRSLSAARAARS
jgi:4-alpha-glucanotransferase